MEIRPSVYAGLASPHAANIHKKNHINISNKLDDVAQMINYDELIFNSAEELADVVSTFGRASKTGRKNDGSYNDSVAEILDENTDEKLNSIISQVGKMHSGTSFLNFARHLFANDWDLFQALRELLLSKKLSELQKKKIKEAIKDLVKFADRKNMNSSANVNNVARRFSHSINQNAPSAIELRNSYLSFLELELPATFLYQGWIDEFGYDNRKLMLSFMLTALIADIKSSEPGIHLHDFGPLSTKLSNARILHTLDDDLVVNFRGLDFSLMMASEKKKHNEESFLKLFLTGLTDPEDLETDYDKFYNDFMSKLIIKQQAIVIQTICRVFNITPNFLYANCDCCDRAANFFSVLLHSLHIKEINQISVSIATTKA